MAASSTLPNNTPPHPTELSLDALHTYLPELHRCDRLWHRGIKQLEMITDSQFLAEVLNARAQYKADNDFDAVYSVLDEYELAFKAGWFPRQLVEPMISWRPRKWNTLADHIANVAATHQEAVSLFREDLKDQLRIPGVLIQLHSDGSLHKESGKGAYSFTMISLHKHQERINRTILAIHGQPLMNQTISTAETLGILHAIRYLNRIN